MSFDNLFVRSRKSIGGIQLDAVLSESHTNTVKVTNNPIEIGADIADNAIIEPKVVTVVAQVSDTPLGAAALGDIVDLVTGLFGTSTTDNITRSGAAYNALVQLQEQREPIELQTKLKLYTDMIITSIRVIQDANTSRIVALNIEFKELIIVESVIVQLESTQLSSGSATEQGSSADEKGRQETTTPNSTTSSSVLKSVLDWVGG